MSVLRLATRATATVSQQLHKGSRLCPKLLQNVRLQSNHSGDSAFRAIAELTGKWPEPSSIRKQGPHSSILAGTSLYALPEVQVESIPEGQQFVSDLLEFSQAPDDQSNVPYVLRIKGDDPNAVVIHTGMGPAAGAVQLGALDTALQGSPGDRPLKPEIIAVFTTHISDRSRAIQNPDEAHPSDPGLTLDTHVRTVMNGVADFAKAEGASSVAVACNTAHRFLPESPLYVHMLESTARHIHNMGVTKAVSAATTGTNNLGQYQAASDNAVNGAVTFMTLPPNLQEQAMHIIYDCVKKGELEQAGREWKTFVDELVALHGEGVVISLNCTELPIANEQAEKLYGKRTDCQFVDPMVVVAETIEQDLRTEVAIDSVLPLISY